MDHMGRPKTPKMEIRGFLPTPLDLESLQGVLPEGMPDDVEMLLSPGTPSTRHAAEIAPHSPIARKAAESRRSWGQVLQALLLALVLTAAVVVILMLSFSTDLDSGKSYAYLRMNEIQVLGSLKSCHVAPQKPILDWLGSRAHASLAKSINFTHQPLSEQLKAGYRHLEIQVAYDPIGGRYLNRAVMGQLGLPTASSDPRLVEKGFKVLNIPDIDFNSTCPTLVDCLEEVKAFSNRHKGHLPICININIVSERVFIRGLDDAIQPLPITSKCLLDVEREIATVFSRNHIIIPDDVRGSHISLNDAVKTMTAWPSLHDAAGKVFFALTPNDAVDTYRAISPALESRTMFTAQTAAGFVEIRNLPDQAILFVETMEGFAKSLVENGHIVIFPVMALDSNFGPYMWDNAVNSGCQLIAVEDLWTERDVTVDNVDDTRVPLLATAGVSVQAKCNMVANPRVCKSGKERIQEPIKG